MTGAPWTWQRGDDPVLATAIHAGCELRPDVAALTALDAATRLREEDPYTDRWTSVAGNGVVVHRSRWEVDMNRSRDRSVYLQAEDCWGLQPWRSEPDAELLQESQGLYDAFYTELLGVCRDLESRYGSFVVLDLHSYNHRRLGPHAQPADPDANPVVNVGTASMPARRWRHLVEGFLSDLNAAGLDARENVRFRGAQLAARIHREFPQTGCCLAVDVKKVFCDEHTGELEQPAFDSITAALGAAATGLRERLRAQA